MRGPVATMVSGSSGMRRTSRRWILTRGSDSTASVMRRANRPRSTARALPAGTFDRVGHPHHERAQAPHLLLEEARGLVEGVAAEAVRADELGEVAGLVDRRLPRRAHLEEVDADAPAGELPRGLAAGEAAPDDRDARSHSYGRV